MNMYFHGISGNYTVNYYGNTWTTWKNSVGIPSSQDTSITSTCAFVDSGWASAVLHIRDARRNPMESARHYPFIQALAKLLEPLANLLKLRSPRSKSPRRRLICLLSVMCPNCSEQPKPRLSDTPFQSRFKTRRQRQRENDIGSSGYPTQVTTGNPYTNENDNDKHSYDGNRNHKNNVSKRKKTWHNSKEGKNQDGGRMRTRLNVATKC